MDDVTLENDESFIVSLGTTDGAVNILQDQTVVTIIDNDSMCNFTLFSVKTSCYHNKVLINILQS